MLKQLTLFMASFGLCHLLYAQRILTGRVLDRSTREPVPELDISIYKGTGYTSTNAHGYFQLEVQEEDSLLLAHPDYLLGLIPIPEANTSTFLVERVISYPVYQEGIAMLYRYLRQHIEWPAGSFRNVEGILLMEILVDSSGSVISSRAINQFKNSFEHMATKVFMSIPGKWTKSHRTNCFIFPIIFAKDDGSSEIEIPQVKLPEGKLMEHVLVSPKF